MSPGVIALSRDTTIGACASVASSPEAIPEGVISSWDIVAFYASAYGRSP